MSKTDIFENYQEFLKREDKDVNGVSSEFVKNNPNYEKGNRTNKGCWNCSYCSSCIDCSHCSSCIDCSHCSYCRSCSSCSYCSSCRSCSSCIDCSYCSYCRSCSYCIDCSYCSSCSYCGSCSSCGSCRSCSSCSSCGSCSYCSYKIGDKKERIKIPKIENIHQKVYASASAKGALSMGEWHTCETTHCRAGWIIHLAGEEGEKIEKFYGSCLGAQLIYRESGYQINPSRFFDDDETAMSEMKRLANTE